ncbi:hypothetical protein BH10BAC2_BH10BAC2_24210 [soil metagenome]
MIPLLIIYANKGDKLCTDQLLNEECLTSIHDNRSDLFVACSIKFV